MVGRRQHATIYVFDCLDNFSAEAFNRTIPFLLWINSFRRLFLFLLRCLKMNLLWMNEYSVYVSVCVWPNRSLSNLFDFWLANLLAIHFDSLNIVKIVWKCKRMLIEIQSLLLLAYTCAVCVCFYLSSSFSRCVHIELELCCQYLPIRISYGNVPVFLWNFL